MSNYDVGAETCIDFETAKTNKQKDMINSLDLPKALKQMVKDQVPVHHF